MTLQPQEMGKLVQDLLDQRPYEEMGLKRTVVAEGIQLDAGFWYVPVSTPTEAAITFNYFGYLADLEEELEQMGHKVVIVPCLEGEVAHREGG